jgi:phosphoribosylformimino-5-aminoimidazole carboxamide ribotide isomerase
VWPTFGQRADRINGWPGSAEAVMAAPLSEGQAMLVPCIDLVKGRAVQLRQGRELELVADEDPRVLAERFGRVGEIAVVDIDAARGTGDNLELVEQLCGIAPCRVGGGIRDVERGQRLLHAGARKLVIGTRAEPAFLSTFPAARLIAAVDARDDQVVDHAWEQRHAESPVERARRLEPHVGGFLFTAVERDGMQGGVDVERIRAVAQAVTKPVTAAGGVRTVQEVRELDRMGVDAQVGMALYRGTFTPGQAIANIMDFAAGEGQLPTVIQDARDGRVLQVAFSTADTLAESVDNGRVVLYATRRGSRALAGESGCGRVVRVEVARDRRALLFHALPTESASHHNPPASFGERPFSVPALEAVITERASAPEDDSYTRRLFGDPVTRHAKILEEASELVGARTPVEARCEAADLLFHVLVDLAAHGVPWQTVIRELESRRRRPIGD